MSKMIHLWNSYRPLLNRFMFILKFSFDGNHNLTVIILIIKIVLQYFFSVVIKKWNVQL